MTKQVADLLIEEYDEYCKEYDGKQLHHLPFGEWLKYKKNITNFPYPYMKTRASH